MKKFNLLKEIIIVDKQELLNAINSQKEFGIKLDGSITYEPQNEIVIYKGQHTQKVSALAPPKPISIQEILGENYKMAESEGKIGIKAANAFREIVKFNYDNALYDDTTNEGVHEFADKKLEEIGWHADEFEIKYRELIDVLEEQCEGTLLCIEQEEPSYQFSGLGFVDDKDAAYAILYKYAQEKIKEKMASDPLFAPENLSEDEEEAARYFKLL